jgi:hypothetical protein
MGVGVFFLPFLSFSFLFSFFLFKLWVHLMWSFCDFFGGLKFFLEPDSLELSDVRWNRNFFRFWSFLLLGIEFAIGSHQWINQKRSMYIAFLVSAEFQVGICKKISFVGLMINQWSLNLCLAYSSSCRASLCWFYFNLVLKRLYNFAELFTYFLFVQSIYYSDWGKCLQLGKS